MIDNEYGRMVVLSGIRSTQDRLHVGNYVGALRKWLALQDILPGKCFFFVADLHSIGDVTNGQQMAVNNLSIATEFLAIGLDPNKATLYIQSQVPELTVLTWLLTAIVLDTELMNLPHYREKRDKFRRQQQTAGGPTTYLVYPILQAADIYVPGLVGDKILVPVGEDQRPHIEFARDLARRFNANYRPLFGEPTLPEDLAISPWVDLNDRERSASNRVKGLDGKEKMGKSEGNCINLEDSPTTIRRLINRGVTDPQRERRGDPGNPDDCRGIYPLHVHLTDLEMRQEMIRPGCLDGNLDCSRCKETLGTTVIAWLNAFREKKAELVARPGYIRQVFGDGAGVVRRLAREKLSQMYETMGLSLPPDGF